MQLLNKAVSTLLVQLKVCAASLTCAVVGLVRGNTRYQSGCRFLVDKGLGELYEEEYVKAARPDGDVLEERDAATKAEARTLLKVRCRRPCGSHTFREPNGL